MASGGTIPVDKEWQQIKDEITCSICGDLFTDPKTIPCLHTFCKQCIEKSIESNKKMTSIVRCPLCRAPLPRDDISSVPTNFTINRLVEIFGKRKEAGKSLRMTCGNCETGSPAITWCVDCETPLCQQCNDTHKTWKAFKSHNVVIAEEFVKNPKLVLSTPEKPEACMLKSHNKQPLDLYCRTCSSFICLYCTLKDHPRKTHDFDFIDDVADEEREKIKQATATLKQLLERVRNGIKRIEESETEIDIEIEANRKKIHGAYSEVYKLLKQQEEKALEKLNTIKMSLKKTLAMQKENRKFMESQLVSCMEFSDDAISANRRRQLLTYKNSIIDRVEDLTKQVEHASIDPECRADDVKVRCGNPAEFISNCLCHITTVTHLPHCSVRGPLAISDPVKVTVTLKDVYGFSVVQQSKDLEIRCNKEGEFLKNVRIEEKESKGVYHIWYNPNRKEDHLLSVYWRGLVVNDEEVKVPVNIRDYANIKQEMKVIDKYGPNDEQLKSPYLMAKGPNNELIVNNDSTHQLVIFDEQLQYSHVIGGRGNGNGKFQLITGIAVDNKGYVYVADYNLHCIEKLTMNGQFVSQFGSKGTDEGQLSSPLGLVLSQSELLFVCDSRNHRIQVFKNELFSYTFGQYGKEPGCFNYPRDLTLNSNEDQLFITDRDNHRVQVFTPSGQFLRIFGNFTDIPFKLQSPVGIYYSPDNHLLISSYDNHCVLAFDEDGRFVSAIEGTYQGKKRFSYPCGVIMIKNGQIVIASNGAHKLVVF